MKILRYITGSRLSEAFAALLLVLLCLMVAGGCSEFVQADAPDTQLSTPLVFEDRSTATAALEEVYAKMRDRGLFAGTESGLSYTLGLYADELDYYDASGEDGFLYQANSLLPFTSEVAATWKDSYAQIYGANAVIYGVEHSQSLAEEDRRQLKGEALFIRALVHFSLSGLFGDIPYIASTDYRANSTAGKITAAAVVQRAREDLEVAAELLEPEYAHASRTRANRHAAQALLARICLYQEDWAAAELHADAVIEQEGLYALEGTVQDAFLSASRATILQFSPQVEGENTLESVTFGFTDGPPATVALSPALAASFEPGDQRRIFWVAQVDTGQQTYYYPKKYTQVSQAGGAPEFSKVLRLSEILLIRSEARARTGNDAGARQDLDAVRHFAGLGDSPAMGQEALLDAILRERRAELFAEFGHRFLDLKRTGRLDTVLGAVKPGWDATDRLFPLPQQELLLQPGLLPQNPGY